MKLRCLILDHDDTMVNSTATVHHPSFLEGVEKLRPGVTMTLDEYFAMNCDPGIFRYYKEVLKLTPRELDFEHDFWIDYVKSHVPQVYPGMKRLVERFHAAGGLLTVVSHNEKQNIVRDWRENGLPEPDLVLGSEIPLDKVKPNPYPVEEIMRTFRLQKDEVLVVDDLLPGWQMAQNAGVPFAAACWAHHVPQIREHMQKNARCFYTPDELEAYIFG